jgi:hypothetical protein
MIKAEQKIRLDYNEEVKRQWLEAKRKAKEKEYKQMTIQGLKYGKQKQLRK